MEFSALAARSSSANQALPYAPIAYDAPHHYREVSMKIKGICLASIFSVLSACGGGSSPTSMAVIKAVPPATEHLLTYGQSLSLGTRAVVNYPTDMSIPAGDDENVGLMFAGGTKPDDLSSLVPFLETTTPPADSSWVAVPFTVGTQWGETPLYGALLTIKGMDTALHIGSAAGQGGAAIVELSKGTVPYARLIAQVTAAKALSPGAYSVLGIIWMQGEADFGNANYSSEFEQLVMDLDHDIRAITGQGPIQFYVCETAQVGIGPDEVSVAASMPQVHIACSDSNYPTVSDGTHLTAASSKAVGIAIGNAIKP
jgi:hypothetical protein